MKRKICRISAGIVIGFALAEGRIRSLDDPISDYLPELKGSAYDGVPIKAVLQMSSGIVSRSW